MKKILLLTLCVLQFLLTLTEANAQVKEGDKTLERKIDSYFKEGVSKGFSGAILVSEKGQIVISKGYGLANKEKGILNTSKTVFDIASNTKQFTAAAILKLVEFNELNLTDSISIFFANLPNDKKDITIHQLLTHTSGLQDAIGGDFDTAPTEQFFKEVFNTPLLHTTSEYSYSNIGYSVLGRVIEIVSNKDYEVFLNEYLFKPSGMEQTGYLMPKWNTELLANGYTKNIGDFGSSITRYQEDDNVSWHLKGNGGINSTQEDMYKWYKALSSYTILNKSLFEKYTTSYIDVSNSVGYAYGWGITKSDRKTKRITHNGHNGAFSHSIIWLPIEDVIILYATNTSSSNVERLAYNVEEIIYNQNYQPEPIENRPFFILFDFLKYKLLMLIVLLSGIFYIIRFTIRRIKRK
jgi:CubicO group peptidase (beta-lactamase class C family)